MPKFAYYEKVIIKTKDPKKLEIDGELGAIMGWSEAEDGRVTYSVHVYRTDISWCAYESELSPTGEFDRRETFYDGTSIRVRVDERGRGEIVDPPRS